MIKIKKRLIRKISIYFFHFVTESAMHREDIIIRRVLRKFQSKDMGN